MSTNDPALNVTFSCNLNNQAGFIFVDVSLTGASLSSTFTGDTTIQVEVGLTGSGVLPVIVSTDTSIDLTLELAGEATSNSQKSNWIGWSKIGEVAFDLDSMNDAGYKALDWSGYVYAILPLGKNAVVYGSGGVTLLYPVGNPYPTFGFKQISTIGVLAKGAVCGTFSQHFFIDNLGQMWQLSEEKGLKLLDYAEYFSGLVNPTLLYDEYRQRALIGDGSVGYTLTTDGLGGGYEELTGFAYIDGAVIVTSPGPLNRRPLQFTTNIIDFKHRGMKSIESVQIGTDSNEELYIAYDYRFKKDTAFRSTLWTRVNKEGVGHLKASGVEFRVKLRVLLAHDFDIDYITIQFKNIDRRFTRGPRESVG